MLESKCNTTAAHPKRRQPSNKRDALRAFNDRCLRRYNRGHEKQTATNDWSRNLWRNGVCLRRLEFIQISPSQTGSDDIHCFICA